MGADGVNYNVRVKYQVDDSGAQGGASRVASMFDGLGKMADKAAGAFDAVAGKLFSLGAMAAVAAGAGGIAALKVGLVDVNAKLEDTTIGMAGAFRMLGAAGTFDAGLGMAKSLMADIRTDAASLPGEFQDFVSMAQTLTAPLLNAGKGIQDIRNLTRDTVVAASSLGVAYDQAAREMAQLLEGHAGGHNVLGTRLGITTSTMIGSKKFNEASAAERADFLNKAMVNAKDALPAFAKSWGGLTSTLSDNMKTLLGKTTAPLFERIKGTLWSIVGDGGLLERNAKRLDRMAASVGAALVRTYDWLFERGQWLVDHWDKIRDTAVLFGHALRDGFEKAWPTIQKIGLFLGEKLQDPGGLLKELVALRVGLGAVSSAGTIANGVAGMAGGGGMAAAGAAAAPVALAAVAAAGAIDVLTQNAHKNGLVYLRLQQWAEGVWADLKQNFGSLVAELVAWGGEMKTVLRPVIDLLGVAFIGALDAMVYAVRAVIFPFRMLASAIAWVVNKIPGFKAEGGGELVDPANVNGQTLKGKPKNVELKEISRAGLQAELAAMEVGAVKGMQKAHGAGKVNVQVTVPMTVLSDADPERLAVGIAKNVKDQFKHAVKGKALGVGALAFE